MNSSNYRLSLDIHDTESSLALRAKKGDSIRKLYVNLTDGGAPYRITPDCTAAFTALKPDGTILFNQAAIENNAVVYALTPQTTAAAGQVKCELRLYGGDGRLITSPRFFLDVDDTVFTEGDEVISQDEYTVLEDAIRQMEEAVARIEADWNARLAAGEFTGPQGPPASVDESLTQPGTAADAAAVGRALEAACLHLTVTLPAADWSDGPPYTQTLPAEAIREEDCPHYGPLYDGDPAARKEAFACIDDLDTGEGVLTFTCFEEKPAADLIIQLEVNR